MTSRFEGPFRWKTLRAQLLSLRDDTLLGQKLSGQNVHASVYPGDGTVLDADRKRLTSTSEGACCAEDGSCTITTEEECTGAYQGDGSDCDPNPCPLLCTPPEIPEIHLKSDCIQCCLGVGGFGEFPGFESDPVKYYLVKTLVKFCEGGGPPDTCTETDTWTCDLSQCALTFPPNFANYCTFDQECAPEGCIGCGPPSCVGGLNDPVPTSSTHAEWICDPEICGLAYSYTIDLSSEFTLGSVISAVNSLLPDYSGEFTSGGCEATSCVTTDDPVPPYYCLERFKYKFTFDAVECTFTIQWQIKFTPGDGGDPTFMDMSEVISPGATESSTYEQLEPDDDCTTAEVVNISAT